MFDTEYTWVFPTFTSELALLRRCAGECLNHLYPRLAIVPLFFRAHNRLLANVSGIMLEGVLL
jgi:hypothetical protein